MKEFFNIDQAVFGKIIKFWKKYKAVYIVFMIAIFFLAFMVSQFYKNEFPAIYNTIKQFIQNDQSI